MRTFIVLLCLVVAAFAFKETLRTVLKSPKDTVQLYNKFKAKQHMRFQGRENRLRFKNFKRNAKFVAEANDHSESAIFALNLFSTMSTDEKKQYLGLNITGHAANSPFVVSSGLQAPSEMLWTSKGAVTEVANQGSCGSCWTFGAVGGLESRYQQKSGKLRKFSEQEYLDCVYEGQNMDGCNGGWPYDGYTYSKNNDGRLASAANYLYAGSDGYCRGSYKPNAAVAAKIDGYVTVGSTESANIEALASGSLSVAFQVTDYFQQYSKGIIKDTTCTGQPNHAVTAVGYTASYVLVKNSWGNTWGEEGFVRFSRNHDNCGLFKYSSYPLLTATGVSDYGPSDPATSYTPSTDDSSPAPAPDNNCGDEAVDCESWMCDYPSLTKVMKQYCAKTCSHCSSGGDGGSGECPSGTVRCADKVCRHEHMC